MSSFYPLLRFVWENTFQSKEILITPICLSISLLILLSLCLEKFVPQSSHHLVYVSVCYLLSLIALSWFCMHIFTSFEQDNTNAHLSVLPVCAVRLYLAYGIITCVYGVISLFVVIGIGWIFLQIQESLEFALYLLGSLIGFIWSISPIGVMCSMISTSSARTGHLIFPLIFFPLTIPLAITSLLAFEIYLWQRGSIWDSPWWIMILGIGLFFWILCAILFREISH